MNSLNSIDFVYWPYLLLGLIIIPVIWLFSYRSLAGLGRVRRFLALTIRTLIVFPVRSGGDSLERNVGSCDGDLCAGSIRVDPAA